MGQPLRMESANLARKVTVCFQMRTESPETQVSSDTRRKETMALLYLPGCLSQFTCPALPLVSSHAAATESSNQRVPASPDPCR